MDEVWIIGCGGTTADGVGLTKVVGTRDDVRKILLSLVNEARQDDKETWEYGTQRFDEVEERPTGSLYAFACFYDYRIDWEAWPLRIVYEYGK